MKRFLIKIALKSLINLNYYPSRALELLNLELNLDKLPQGLILKIENGLREEIITKDKYFSLLFYLGEMGVLNFRRIPLIFYWAPIKDLLFTQHAHYKPDFAKYFIWRINEITREYFLSEFNQYLAKSH